MFNAIRIVLFVGTCIAFFMVGVFAAEQEKTLAITSMVLASLGLMLNFAFYSESLCSEEEKRSIPDFKSHLSLLAPFFKISTLYFMIGCLAFVELLHLVFKLSVALQLHALFGMLTGFLLVIPLCVIIIAIQRFAKFVHQKTSKV